VRHVLCVPGNWRSFDQVHVLLSGPQFDGFRLDTLNSRTGPLPTLARSFEQLEDRTMPSLTDDDIEQIAGHKQVAYIASPDVDRSNGVLIARKALELTKMLLQGDASGVMAFSSGLSRGRDGWLRLASLLESARRDGNDALAGLLLCLAWVQRLIGPDEDGTFYSCGFHLFGLPDVEVPASGDERADLGWVTSYGDYTLGVGPGNALRDGDTFSQGPDTIVRRIRLRPCTRYAPNSLYFNPKGYVRIEPTAAV